MNESKHVDRGVPDTADGDDQIPRGSDSVSLMVRDSKNLWASISCGWLGVILMGAIYGCLVSILVSGLMVFLDSQSNWQLLFLAAVFVFCIGPIVGVFVWGLASAIAMLAVMLVNLTMGMGVGRRTSVAVFGGLTGFLSTFWVLLNSQSYFAFFIGICFVVAAITLGQVAALVWAGRTGLWAMTWASQGFEARLQFQVRHLLVATIWFSGMMALDQFFSRHELILFLGLYIFLQSFLLLLDTVLVKRKLAKLRFRRLAVSMERHGSR